MRQYLLKSVWHGCPNRLRREKSDRENHIYNAMKQLRSRLQK